MGITPDDLDKRPKIEQIWFLAMIADQEGHLDQLLIRKARQIRLQDAIKAVQMVRIIIDMHPDIMHPSRHLQEQPILRIEIIAQMIEQLQTQSGDIGAVDAV